MGSIKSNLLVFKKVKAFGKPVMTYEYKNKSIQVMRSIVEQIKASHKKHEFVKGRIVYYENGIMKKTMELTPLEAFSKTNNYRTISGVYNRGFTNRGF